MLTFSPDGCPLATPLPLATGAGGSDGEVKGGERGEAEKETVADLGEIMSSSRFTMGEGDRRTLEEAAEDDEEAEAFGIGGRGRSVLSFASEEDASRLVVPAL